jgi:hypothetical protein
LLFVWAIHDAQSMWFEQTSASKQRNTSRADHTRNDRLVMTFRLSPADMMDFVGWFIICSLPT